MYLYLIQHARSKPVTEDPERGISSIGKKETLEICRYIKTEDIKTDEIWVSSKKRSQETADLITMNTSLENMIYEKDFLNPDDPVETAAKFINHRKKNIMIVGHLPFLSKLSSFLLTGSVNFQIIKYRNSGIVTLAYENDIWSVISIINP